MICDQGHKDLSSFGVNRTGVQVSSSGWPTSVINDSVASVNSIDPYKDSRNPHETSTDTYITITIYYMIISDEAVRK